MRLRSQGPEISGNDTLLIGFDTEMSYKMAEGIATIWQTQTNAKLLEKVLAERGDRATATSASAIEHAATILTSRGLAGLGSPEEPDAERVDAFLAKATDELSSFNADETTGLTEMGYLALLGGAEKAVTDQIDAQWQSEYAARLVGREVMLWKPASWHRHTLESESAYRSDAPYSSAGHGQTNMNVSGGMAINGTVTEISLQHNGTITLADGIKSYDSTRRDSSRMPKQIAEKEADPWEKFVWFQASEIFQADRNTAAALPKFKVDEA